LLPVAVERFPQFRRGCRDITGSQHANDPPLALQLPFPLGLLYAIAKTLKEHLQQIADSDQRQ
jgi:hypothetical protein